jgi:hypothetical protein
MYQKNSIPGACHVAGFISCLPVIKPPTGSSIHTPYISKQQVIQHQFSYATNMS